MRLTLALSHRPHLALYVPVLSSNLSADLGRAMIDLLNLGAMHAAHDHQRRTEFQEEIQLAAHPFCGVRQTLGRLQTRREMRDRLLIGRPANCQVAGAHAVITGGSRPVPPRRNDGQQFRLARRQFGESFLECAGDALMPFAPATQKQTLICHVPHQRMLEAEAPFRTVPFGKDNARCDQLRQRGLHIPPAA